MECLCTDYKLSPPYCMEGRVRAKSLPILTTPRTDFVGYSKTKTGVENRRVRRRNERKNKKYHE